MQALKVVLNSQTAPAWTRWFALALLVGVPGVFVLTLSLRSGMDAALALQDDAFYYLEVAERIAAGQGSTFDGFDPTNGYHPAWMAICVVVALLAPTSAAAIVGLLVVCLATWVLTVAEVDRIGRLLDKRLVTIAAALPLAGWGVHMVFQGMETALTVLLLVHLMRRHVQWKIHASVPHDRRALLLGVLLLAVVLSRLDAGFMAVAYGVMMAWTWRQRPGGRRAAILVASPAIVGMSMYLLVNAAMFGSATPVSGRAKAVGGASVHLGPVLEALRAPDTDLARWAGALTLLLLPVALWACSWWSTRGGDQHLAGMRTILVALAAGELCNLAYLTVFSSYPLWPWYHYLLPVLLFAELLLIGAMLARQAAIERLLPMAVAGGAMAVALLFVTTDRHHWDPSAVDAAESLDQLVPAEDPIAMGDRAGAFAFATDRPVVQLEGLVNSPEWLDLLKHGGAGTYLAERDVTLYARSSSDPGMQVEGTSCTRYPEPALSRHRSFQVTVCDENLLYKQTINEEWGTFQIWRLRPGSLSN